MTPPASSRRALLVYASLVISMGCGGARATAATPRTANPESVAADPATEPSSPSPTNGTARATSAEATSSASGTSAAPLLSSVPECDAYLRLYQRCESALAPAIAAGDRRDFEHERGWLDYLAGTPEVAAMPESCRAATRELQSVCP